MKRHIIAAAIAATILSNASAQVNSPSSEGFLSRAREMYADANFIGCLDQLSRLQQLPTTETQRQDALLLQGAAAVHTDKAQAAALLRKYLELYPASQCRAEAMLYLADCYDGDEALSIYRKVKADMLTGDLRNDLHYRLGLALLKAGNLNDAKRELAQITDDKRYADALKFYQGYIAYAKGQYREALPLLEQARSTEAPGNMANYYLAQIYYLKGDYRQALSAANSMLKAKGANPLDVAATAEATRIAGESAFMLGDNAQASKLLRSYLSLTEVPEPSALYILGLFAYQAGDYAKAVKYLEPATAAEDAMSQSAYLYIGQAMMAQGDYDGAIMAFDKALNLEFDPQIQEVAYYNYAVASMSGAKVPFGKSVGIFENFIRKFPQSQYAPQAQEYVVAAYFNDQDYAGFISSIANVPNLTTDTRKAQAKAYYLMGSQKMTQGNAKEALQLFNSAKELSQRYKAAKDKAYDASLDREIDLQLGDAYYLTGDMAKAASHLRSYIKVAPATAENLPLAHYDLGYALFAQRQYKAAISEFERFLNAPGKAAANILADANCRLGDCYFYTSQYANAAQAYDKAYAINPTSGDYAMFQKALMEGYQRHHQSKIDLLADMRHKFPSSALIPDAMLETTESYIQLGKNSDAINVYEELIAKYPDTPQGRQGYLQMALTLLNAGQRAKAIDAYKHVISRYPTSDEAQVAADQLKRVAAQDGTLHDYVSFMASVPNAPSVDANEVERLAFEAAEKEYIMEAKTERLADYLSNFASAEQSANAANAAKALSYLMEDAMGRNDADQAYLYACQLTERYPDSSSAIDALATKASVEEMQGKGMLALRTWQALEQKASTPYALNKARMGIARNASDAGDHALVIETVGAALASANLSDENRYEALFLRGKSHAANGDIHEARADWEKAADNPADVNSMRSAYYLAQSYFDANDYATAETCAKEVANASTPHIYWMARGFILLSDIYKAQGNDYKSQQYLKSLRNNYPGNEADIFQMIDQRLR